MLWIEKEQNPVFKVPDDVQDLSFRIQCKELPIDHSFALAEAIQNILPWMADEPNAAIHAIHGAASGNGWNRPDNPINQKLQLSRRTRLYIRLPKHRLEDAKYLCDKRLMVEDCEIHIDRCQPRPLVISSTLFARSVCDPHVEDETAFTEQIVAQLKARNIHITRILYGLLHQLSTGPSKQDPENRATLNARSVLLTDLEPRDCVALQQMGLGQHRLMGCGIFLPHKSLAAVGQSQEENL